MSPRPFDRIGRPRHADVLTPAEWEVLAGLREGCSNREIAAQRRCDLETVRFHLRNLRRKLDVRGRDELRAFPGRPAESIARARAARRTRRIREQIPLIETHDVARALSFYVDVLGFELVSRWPDDGGVPGWAALGSGGARLMVRRSLEPRHAERPRRSAVQPNLYVDDLDGFRALLERAGHRCSPTRSLFYGARELDLLDPDGNLLVLVEFAASEPRYLASAGKPSAAATAKPKKKAKKKDRQEKRVTRRARGERRKRGGKR